MPDEIYDDLDIWDEKTIKCNCCHLGLCDPELDFHVGTHYIEDE